MIGEVALALLSSIGLTIIVTLSRIATPIRKGACVLWAVVSRDKCPAYCSQCTGFWVGSAAGGVIELLEPRPFAVGLAIVVSLACSTSILSLVVSTWLRAHGEYTDPPD